METQKIVNFLNREWIFKFAHKKWYVIDSESKSGYSHNNPKKFLTKSIESSLCDYSDAHIIVTGNIAVTRTSSANPNANSAVEKKVKEPRTAATQVGFKNCAPFIVHMMHTAGDDQVSVNSFKKYFLPRVKIENYNIKIEIFMISQLMTWLSNTMKLEKY